MSGPKKCPSKRSKAMDQKFISLAEFKADKTLVKWVKVNIIASLGWLEVDFPKQLVNRVKASAKRRGLGPIGLLEELYARARK